MITSTIKERSRFEWRVCLQHFRPDFDDNAPSFVSFLFHFQIHFGHDVTFPARMIMLLLFHKLIST